MLDKARSGRARHTHHRLAELADAPSLHHCDHSDSGGHRGPLASWVHNLGRDGVSARILGVGVGRYGVRRTGEWGFPATENRSPKR